MVRKFWPTQQPLGRGVGVGLQIKLYRNSWMTRFDKRPGWWAQTWKCWESSIRREGMEAPSPSPTPHTLPLHLFHLVELHPFTINWWSSKQMSLSSVSHSNKLIEPRRGLWLVKSTGDNLDLWLASEVGRSLIALSPSPTGSDAMSR